MKRFNLDKIKKHPFYLKGKNIFKEKFPELIDKIDNGYYINKEEMESFIKNYTKENIKTNDRKFKAYENQKENININNQNIIKLY